ncbi:phosphonopyruvate decarboxylase [Promethearchaeum syntrophicum]|uniref:sulfopyruvate decarboxylase n=1 Tax=Promethearchaeum syntrophicum TaxID=2594042 RepID=A0A5B9D9G6_9ARCH|nr:phosphonopyruvate decarboxylase [Candidatus Prometheoarchaeum syntrophicum]QEE15794.1 Sulfopyruvate decarboxylase subunit beta [Candidatus Prometheoarchaeum syntrophicum]
MNCNEIWNGFKKHNFSFFTGVPDSTFKAWMTYLDENNGNELKNIIACNECEAVAIASGYHLATKNVGVVYMQNSGFGKTVNPITSLADFEVYSIPILLMIGWRGEPGKKDEPQHKKMGRVMIPILEALEIPYSYLPETLSEFEQVLQKISIFFKDNKKPYALIVKKNIIEPFTSTKRKEITYEMTREEALKTIIESFTGDEVIVSTTGKTSREIFELRIARGENPRDFYTVGSMGCTSSIALGIALNSKKKTVVLDGDGALIMQLGALTTIGHYHPENFFHILIDNNAHESTGGQPTVSDTINFKEICLGSGYTSVYQANNKEELKIALNKMFKEDGKGPSMLIIKVKKGSRDDLGRPTTTPIQNKDYFMKFLQD